MSLGEWVEFQLEYYRLAPFTSPIAAQALNDTAPDGGYARIVAIVFVIFVVGGAWLPVATDVVAVRAKLCARQ